MKEFCEVGEETLCDLNGYPGWCFSISGEKYITYLVDALSLKAYTKLWIHHPEIALCTDAREECLVVDVIKRLKAVPLEVLTAADWEELVRCLQSEHWIGIGCNTDFGFGYGMKLHQIVDQNNVEPLAVVTQSHLPWQEGRPLHFEQAWSLLSPLTHSPRMKLLASWYGLPESREKDYYEY
jgi:hypothetical protein